MYYPWAYITRDEVAWKVNRIKGEKKFSSSIERAEFRSWSYLARKLLFFFLFARESSGPVTIESRSQRKWTLLLLLPGLLALGLPRFFFSVSISPIVYSFSRRKKRSTIRFVIIFYNTSWNSVLHEMISLVRILYSVHDIGLLALAGRYLMKRRVVYINNN